MPYDPITWIQLINCEAFGLPPNSLRKNAGGSGAFDAGAISQEQIAAATPGIGMICQFPFGTQNDYVFVGLSNTNPDQNYASIRYALFWSGSIVDIYELGVYKGSFAGIFTSATIFSIQINTLGQIEYCVDGVLQYTSTLTPTFPLFVDTSLYWYTPFARSQVDNVKIGSEVVAEKISHLMMMEID